MMQSAKQVWSVIGTVFVAPFAAELVDYDGLGLAVILVAVAIALVAMTRRNGSKRQTHLRLALLSSFLVVASMALKFNIGAERVAGILFICGLGAFFIAFIVAAKPTANEAP